MYLVKVRQTLKQMLRGENVRIVRQPRDLYARDVRVRCTTRDRGRLVRMIKGAGLVVRPLLKRTCIDVTSVAPR